MKFLALFLVVAVAIEAILGQCLRSCGPDVVTTSIAVPACLPAAEVVYSPAIGGGGCSPAIIKSNSLAANLADTLSLLTVSSLLAEKLPLGCSSVVASVPIASGCGCGCGCGYGPYGYIL